MILEELSSNLPSFHAIRFKKGLNFIIGKKTAESDEKGSYNGVGKSLVIELIHFCLGANKVKALSVIGHYYCTLKFSHKNCSYSIKRFFDDNQDVYFDDKLILLSDLKQKLYNLIFDNNKKINNVGFRSLISRYIRRYKANYTSYYNFVKKESSEVELLNNGLVLGIDADTIVSKIDNKEKLTELNRTKKSLKSDKILLDYFTGKYSIDFKIRDLNDKLKKLYDEKKNFKIAENYYDLKKQADDLSQQIRNLNNQKFLINSRIQRIDKMMGTNISVSDQELKDLYSEIEKYIKIENLKQINDLMKFHNALNFNREEAFKSQKNDYENQLLDLNLKISNKNEELSLLLKNLSDSGALEDYNNLCSEITQTETNLKKITDYKNLMKQYEMEINISKKKKTEITISNQLYIDNHKNDFFAFDIDNDALDSEQLRKFDVDEGSLIYMLGYPMGLVNMSSSTPICRLGCIARMDKEQIESTNNILVDIQNFPGNSGSPIIYRPEALSIEGTKNLMNSVLIGIVHSYIPYRETLISSQTGEIVEIRSENSGLAYAHPVEYIRHIIDDFFKKNPNIFDM